MGWAMLCGKIHFPMTSDAIIPANLKDSANAVVNGEVCLLCRRIAWSSSLVGRGFFVMDAWLPCILYAGQTFPGAF